MAGELIRNLSENLPVEGACPRLWCRPKLPPARTRIVLLKMAGELIRNLSEKLPVEGACPCLWCRPVFVWCLCRAQAKKKSRYRLLLVTTLKRWCRRGDSAPFDIWDFNRLNLL